MKTAILFDMLPPAAFYIIVLGKCSQQYFSIIPVIYYSGMSDNKTEKATYKQNENKTIKNIELRTHILINFTFKCLQLLTNMRETSYSSVQTTPNISILFSIFASMFY